MIFPDSCKFSSAVWRKKTYICFAASQIKGHAVAKKCETQQQLHPCCVSLWIQFETDAHRDKAAIGVEETNRGTPYEAGTAVGGRRPVVKALQVLLCGHCRKQSVAAALDAYIKGKGLQYPIKSLIVYTLIKFLLLFQPLSSSLARMQNSRDGTQGALRSKMNNRRPSVSLKGRITSWLANRGRTSSMCIPSIPAMLLLVKIRIRRCNTQNSFLDIIVSLNPWGHLWLDWKKGLNLLKDRGNQGKEENKTIAWSRKNEGIPNWKKAIVSARYLLSSGKISNGDCTQWWTTWHIKFSG